MKAKEVVDELTVKRAITRITYEIIERNKDLNKIVLAGIKTRGVFIAHRIQERLEQLENRSVPVVELDTKPFRDDVKSGEDTSLVSVDVTDREVILVDDVLYTGRTIRAAIPVKSNGYIFSRENFQQSAKLTRLLKKIGLPRTTFHGLRDTHASFLFSQDIDIVYVSRRLGHVNIQTTQNYYLELMPEKRHQQDADALNLLSSLSKG